MPIYDCGDPDCQECEREFGPDRKDAIERRQRREAAYEKYAAEQNRREMVGK